MEVKTRTFLPVVLVPRLVFMWMPAGFCLLLGFSGFGVGFLSAGSRRLAKKFGGRFDRLIFFPISVNGIFVIVVSGSVSDIGGLIGEVGLVGVDVIFGDWSCNG